MTMVEVTLSIAEEDAAVIEEMARQVNTAQGGCYAAASLLECFAADLAGGESSAGSDERLLARDWLMRCFGVGAQGF